MKRKGTWTLINYFDVWGNAKEGWEVNNQCVEMDDVEIADDATDKDVCNYLKDHGFLTTSDMRRLEVTNCGDLMEINERKGHKPLFALMMNY